MRKIIIFVVIVIALFYIGKNSFYYIKHDILGSSNSEVTGTTKEKQNPKGIIIHNADMALDLSDGEHMAYLMSEGAYDTIKRMRESGKLVTIEGDTEIEIIYEDYSEMVTTIKVLAGDYKGKTGYVSVFVVNKYEIKEEDAQ